MEEKNINKIGELVRRKERSFVSQKTKISKYVEISPYEDICTIDAYVNSKHISGEFDSIGREKPFFNIVTSASNICFRATDLDIVNINVYPTEFTNVINSFFATQILQDYMRRENFSIFLNEWGKVLSVYGSAITKWTKEGDRLVWSIPQWTKMIFDPISFEDNPVIEILELTEDQLRANTLYDQEKVEELCKSKQARMTTDKQRKDNESDYFRLYEVHGVFPLSYSTGKESDKNIFEQQIFVICFESKNKDGRRKPEYDEYILYKGREENPYILTHLIKETGQTLSFGTVRQLFNAQWMANHSVKLEKDMLDIAGKIVFQTADETFLGKNFLTDLENGDIFIHKSGQPLTQLNNSSHDLTSLQSYMNQWKIQANEINGISEAMMGSNQPAGTAWRQVEALLQESHSLFKLMTENKGLYLKRIIKEKIIPNEIKKILRSDKEILSILKDSDIQKIDSKFLKSASIKEARKKIIKDVIEKDLQPTAQDQEELINNFSQQMQSKLSELGNKRFLKPDEVNWKEELKDIKWNIEIDITGESVDTQAKLATVNTFLQFMARKNGQPLTEEERFWLNKIMIYTGVISPAEYPNFQSEEQKQPLPVLGR